MNEMQFAIQRDRLARYGEIMALLLGVGVVGWLLLRLGLRRAFGDWAQSLEYTLLKDELAVSGCFTLRGFVLYRYDKRIPLSKITDVKLVQGPVLNKMGLWQMSIQTASGSTSAEAVLHALAEPHQVRDQILQAIEHTVVE